MARDARFDPTRDSLLHECAPAADQHDVPVGHGNVIRWLVARALGPDPKRWTRMDIANAWLTVINIRGHGSTHRVMLRDVGHIPVEKRTRAGVGGGVGTEVTAHEARRGAARGRPSRVTRCEIW